jgi:hypothetical protein
MGCKHDKCEHGQKSDLARDFQVAPRTISRVWESMLSAICSHLTNNLMFPELEQLFDNHMLPLRHFPDHVFVSLKKGIVGRKKEHDCAVLVDRSLNVPVTERGEPTRT